MELYGAMSALVTPFDTHGNILEESVKEILDYQIGAGINGIYVSGSTGEAMALPAEKRMQMAELTVKHVNGRVPVIVHVGTIETATAVALAKHARAIGADAISAVPPYYYKMNNEAIERHYFTIADSTDLPFLVYNIPNLTGVVMGAEFIARLAGHANIIGCKFTDMNLEELRKIKAVDNGRIKVFMGIDAFLLSSLVLGSDGGIGTFYNIMPGPLSRVYEAFRQGDLKKAMSIQWEVNRYITMIKKYINGGLFTGVKNILNEMGLQCGTVTPPIIEMPEEKAKAMIADLKANGFFEFNRS